jgi:hypothetical protein
MLVWRLDREDPARSEERNRLLDLNDLGAAPAGPGDPNVTGATPPRPG